jgi:hypothetical protein
MRSQLIGVFVSGAAQMRTIPRRGHGRQATSASMSAFTGYRIWCISMPTPSARCARAGGLPSNVVLECEVVHISTISSLTGPRWGPMSDRRLDRLRKTRIFVLIFELFRLEVARLGLHDVRGLRKEDEYFEDIPDEKIPKDMVQK